MGRSGRGASGKTKAGAEVKGVRRILVWWWEKTGVIQQSSPPEPTNI